MKRKKWYKIDNAGKFFALTNKNMIPAVFRYSVTIINDINPSILQDALDKSLESFPSFNVYLKRGFFWYYLEATNKKYLVTEEHNPICERIYKDSDEVLFRVTYYRNRINLEISHILSDGRGSLNFFKSIINNYVEERYNISDIKDVDTLSSNEQAEDSFDKNYTKTSSYHAKNRNIYHYKDQKTKNITYMEYHIPTKEVLDLAHSYNVTLTSLLLSVLIFSFKKKMKRMEYNKDIKITIPVDLRSYFNSNTSRNFFGVTSVLYNFEKSNDDFESVVKDIDRQLKDGTTIQKLRIRMNQMIRFEKNPLIKIVPIFIKDFVLNIIDYCSEFGWTSCLSNIGVIKMDEKSQKYIKNFNVLDTTRTLKLTVCSYNDDLSIGISTKYENNDIIKAFCGFFAKRGINGTLNINWSDDNGQM